MDKKMLTTHSERFVKRKIKIYLEQLQFLFGSSSASTVYHCSVLERIIEDIPLLPMYFAILNSFIRAALKTTTIYNRYNQPIRFKFINVSDQFHRADDPTTLFRRNEVRSGEMTHRTPGAYKIIYTKLHDEIVKDVASHG